MGHIFSCCPENFQHFMVKGQVRFFSELINNAS